jgi:hypothetical protein
MIVKQTVVPASHVDKSVGDRKHQRHELFLNVFFYALTVFFAGVIFYILLRK